MSWETIAPPSGKATHHAQPMCPSVVVGRAERGLPTQEQIDRDVIDGLAIGEGGEQAQDAFFEGHVEAKTAPDGEVVRKLLRERRHARPPSTGQARAIERSPSISCLA
jgi:hypothetical protein